MPGTSNAIISILRFIVFAHALLLLGACAQEKKKEVPEEQKPYRIYLQDQMPVNSVSFSDFFSLERIVNLEVTSNSLMVGSPIMKIACHKGKILISEVTSQQEKLMVFDLNTGQYLHAIGKSGEGPEEYWGLRDFAIDYTSDRIFLLSAGKMAIMEFGWDGIYAGYMRPGVFGDEIEIWNNDFIIYNEYNPTDLSGNYSVLCLDRRSGKIKGRMFNYADLQMQISFSGFLSENHNRELLFSPAFGDTIFVMTPQGSFVPRYIFDLGPDKVPEEVRKNPMLLMQNLMGKTYISSRQAELASGLLIGFTEGNLSKTGYFRHADEKFYVVSGFAKEIINRLFAMSEYLIPMGGDQVGVMIKPDEWFFLKDLFANQMEKIQREYPIIAERIRNATDNDNPAILIFRIRQ